MQYNHQDGFFAFKAVFECMYTCFAMCQPSLLLKTNECFIYQTPINRIYIFLQYFLIHDNSSFLFFTIDLSLGCFAAKECASVVPHK